MPEDLYGLLLIFFARVCDVTLGTFRIVLVSRGYRNIAPVIGFFEIFIWIAVVGKVIGSLNGVYSYLAYASGFAAGNYVGMILESRVSIGYQAVRVVTSEKVTALPLSLRSEGFGITTFKGMGMKGEVNLIYATIRRRRVGEFIEIVKTLEPAAFITVEDVRNCSSGFIRSREYMKHDSGRIRKAK